MSTRISSRFGLLIFAAAAFALSFAPTSDATPVHYDFSVQINAGALGGTTALGSFSYDSSSIVPGGSNSAAGLLTALEFTLNGITYDADTANTGVLTFNALGELTQFSIGNHCPATGGNCSLISLPSNSWFMRPNAFVYTSFDPETNHSSAGIGTVSYWLAPPQVSVPEPGTLGLFGFGALLMGVFAGLRRRVC